MKIIAAFEKTKEISYTSHLDVQRTLQRAFRRADLPLAFSKGFNPHPKLSFATALATGYTSAGEWIEVELDKELTPEVFTERVNAALPDGMRFVSAFVADDGFPTLSKLLVAAKYVVTLYTDAPVTTEQLHAAVDAIMLRLKAEPERTQRMFLLYYGYGMKLGDIAKELGTTEAGVKSCLVRVRRKLRATLKEENI